MTTFKMENIEKLMMLCAKDWKETASGGPMPTAQTPENFNAFISYVFLKQLKEAFMVNNTGTASADAAVNFELKVTKDANGDDAISVLCTRWGWPGGYFASLPFKDIA